MVKSPPKKVKKNSIPQYLEDNLHTEGGGIMTPVIQTSSAATQPPTMVRMLKRSASKFPCILHGIVTKIQNCCTGLPSD